MVIHPTAIIHPKANIAPSVTIGPYSTIGKNVTIMDGTVIGSYVTIEGVTTIGRNNRIYNYASIGCDPQDKKYDGEMTALEIGDRNTFREYITISTGTIQDAGATRIGNNNWMMSAVHIAHDCQIGDNTIFANTATLGGHVRVGDWTVISSACLVHQHVTIGEHVMISGNTGVTLDIPPYIIAQGYRAEPYGINVEGLRRRGFSADTITEIKRAYKLIYRQKLPLTEARLIITERAKLIPELILFDQFFAQSKRGLTR